LALFSHKLMAQSDPRETTKCVFYVVGIENKDKAETLAKYLDSVKKKITFYKIDMTNNLVYINYRVISKEEVLQCIQSNTNTKVMESPKYSYNTISSLPDPEKPGIVY